MHRPAQILGTFRPLGGGDPVELKKDELVVGRRPTSDIRLDFENVSGKHALLRFVKGVWHIRDLGSTNGTSVNGQGIAHETGIMPGDDVGVANHFFTIDYDPIAPTSLMDANQFSRRRNGRNEATQVADGTCGIEPRRGPVAPAAAASESAAREDRPPGRRRQVVRGSDCRSPIEIDPS